MIQMADDQFLVTKIDQPVQQRDGIAPAGNADQVAGAGWEITRDFFFFD